MNRKREIFIWVNLAIFITMIIAVTSTLIVGSRATRLDGDTAVGASQLTDGTFGGVKIEYWYHVVSFTILSNIFLGVVALVSAIIAMRKPQKAFSQRLTTWYLVAASSGMLTFLTVLLFLAPMRAINDKNYFDMLLEQMFVLHFLNPILCAINYVLFLETKEKVGLKPRLLALLPPIIYASPYIIFVCIIHWWPDFYGLTFGGNNYLILPVFIIFCLFMFGISSTLAALHNHFSKS